MPYNNRIANLLTGASLAALSLVGGRSALGATLTGTGTTVIATDTDFVRIEAPADYDRVTNNAIISDGFEDNFPDRAVAVWVTTNANVDVFVNNKVIQAIEGTNAANNASTPSATATGMLIDGTVPLLINHGLIDAKAVAHATAPARANATAYGIRSNGSGTIKNDKKVAAFASARATSTTGRAIAQGFATGVFTNGGPVKNEGVIAATALAVGNAAGDSAFVTAAADGVRQQGSGSNTTLFADNSGDIKSYAKASAYGGAGTANGIAFGNLQNISGDAGSATVDNDGAIAVTAAAVASATLAHATAIGLAAGVAQNVTVDSGPAKASVDNHGDINVHMQASAFSPSSAAADAPAVGVGQFILAGTTVTGGSTAKATVHNEGDINVKASGLASSDSGNALANEFAVGVQQSIAVITFISPPERAVATVDNDGEISGYARGSAFGDNAEVNARAFGVTQDIHALTIATATVDNRRDIKAKARALAESTSGSATANVFVIGADEDVEANGGNGVATAKLGNDGDISAYGKAEAFAKLHADASVNDAAGAAQSASANGGDGVAKLMLDNEGRITIRGHSLAHSTSGDAGAFAYVTGVDQDAEANGGSGTAEIWLDNEGDIEGYAEAKAFGKTGADVTATANGVDQSASANDGSGTAEVWLDNKGSITARVYALAESTSGDAEATEASAFGVDQGARARDGFGTAKVRLDNKGHIEAYVDAKAFAKMDAGVSVFATGVDQAAFADGGGGMAAAKLDNHGDIGAKAQALADATSGTAVASADAVGVDQAANATDFGNDGGDKRAEAWLDNWGYIGAYAGAEGFAKSDADVSANATGVEQRAVARFGTLGTAEIGLDNHGDIKAKAHALGEASSSAEATAIAFGVDQIAQVRGLGKAAISLDSDGHIGASAGASASADAATAGASATGVRQSALADAQSSLQSGQRAMAWLGNDGTIRAYGEAVASGKTDASANANASGVDQGAVANTFTGGDGVGSLKLYNDGDIAAKARGLADARSGSAEADAGAVGVNQHARANGGGGTAKIRLDNDGKIAAHAEGSALALAASASVTATGVVQFPEANDGGGLAKASLDNHGDIDAYAAGKALAENTAFLSMGAFGALQDARAVDGGGVAKMRLHNDGRIAAKAIGLADAASGSAIASVQATGVGQIARAGGGGGQAEVALDNKGDIEARVAAKAFAKTKAGVNVEATGLHQRAFAEDGGGAARVKADNSGTIKAFADATAEGATATAAARAAGIFIQGSADGGTFDVDIHNSGVVVAAAKAAANGAAASASAQATGIFVTGTGDGSTKITNDSGTIWAGWSTGGAFNRGNAINVGGLGGFEPAPNPALIALKGNNGPGHLYGDIVLSDDDRIEVTQGKTYFDGVVLGDSDADGNSLDIFDGGNLVLCQDGWTGACDPGGWAGAGPEGNGYDPQTGTSGPSYVFIDTFTVQQDGMLTYQLTSGNGPGDYPQVTAGTANLDGTLRAVYLPAFYADQTTYQDVISADTRNGTFDQVTDNSIFLETTAIYDGNTVDLMATRNAFDEVVAKPSKNQGAVSSAIENVYPKLPGPGVDPATQNPFAQLVANLFTIGDVGDYKLLLDQLSGAQYAQYLQSVLWSLRALDQSITDRMDCSLNVTGGAVVTGDKFLGATAGPDGCFTPHQVQTWVRAWGGWNDNDGDLNAPGYSEDQFGIWAGADYALNSRWFIGAAAGYFDSEMDFNNWGGMPGGTIDYDGGQIALYGGYDNAVWYDRAIVKFGWYSGDSHRNFGLTTVVDPSGSPDADVVDFYNEVGRRFALGATSMLTPYFGITVAHAELDGFTEKDPYGTGAALKVAGSDADSVATALGLRYNGNFGAFKPQVAVAWEHEFEDTFQTVNMSFADAPAGSNFKTIGTDLDEDSILVEAGGAYALNDSSDFSVRYFGRWLSDYDAQSVMGRYTYKFGAAPAPVLAPEPLKLGSE